LDALASDDPRRRPPGAGHREAVDVRFTASAQPVAREALAFSGWRVDRAHLTRALAISERVSASAPD
jgi:hypothetical protein